MNRRSSSLTRLLSHLRGLVSIEDTQVNRRDLSCAHHSEVQLELDFRPHSGLRFNAEGAQKRLR